MNAFIAEELAKGRPHKWVAEKLFMLYGGRLPDRDAAWTYLKAYLAKPRP